MKVAAALYSRWFILIARVKNTPLFRRVEKTKRLQTDKLALILVRLTISHSMRKNKQLKIG